MNWIRDAVFFVLLSALTECILVLMWTLFKWICGKNLNVHYSYQMLKGVLGGYFIAFVYLIYYRIWEIIQNCYDAFSIGNEIVDKVINSIFFVWLLGVFYCMFRQLFVYVLFFRVCHIGSWKTKEYAEMVKKICNELGINKNIDVFWGYGVQSPFITGVFHPKIYLPVVSFKDEEMEIIFYHELIHYKQRDTLIKPFFYLLQILYWFNPLSWKLQNELEKWTEVNCDFYCCEAGIDKKTYFSLLYKANEKIEITPRHNGIVMWAENNKELKWRLQCMKKYQIKTRGIRAGIVGCIAIILAGVLSITMVTAGVRQAYTGILFQTTKNEVQEVNDDFENNMEEYEGSVSDFKGMKIVSDSKSMARASNMVNVDWNVKNRTIHTSTEFNGKTNGKITVSMVVNPDNRIAEVGIIKPNGENVSVREKEVITHVFRLKKNGKYKVYVKNESGKKLNIKGHFIVE